MEKKTQNPLQQHQQKQEQFFSRSINFENENERDIYLPTHKNTPDNLRDKKTVPKIQPKKTTHQ